MTVTADGLQVATEPLVRQHAASLARKAGGAPVLLLRAQPLWDGPADLTVRDDSGAERRVLVRPAVSALAVRQAMRERADDELLVVLTDRSDADLGLGVLSRCYHQRVIRPSLDTAIREAFRAVEVDPALARLSWAAEPLVLHAPPGGWPVAPAGVLTRDHALAHLTAALLGLPVTSLDPSGLLEWTLEPSGTFIEQAPRIQEGVIAWIRDVGGPVGALALSSRVQGHSVDALTIGLVADVLWSSQPPSPEIVAARTRLEQWTGQRNLDPVVARALADAARGAALRMAGTGDPRYPSLLARAAALFVDVGYAEGAAASTLLPAGYEARLAALAAAVRSYVGSPAGGLVEVEARFADLLGHVRAPAERGTGVARMAVRTCRWLATPEPPAPTDLAQACMRQVTDDAFADWALADVWVGSTAADVAAAWQELFRAGRARRDAHDREFATLLADATQRALLPDSLVPVESAVVRILAPLASCARLLVVVIDGMSTAVAAELADQVAPLGWFEAVPDSTGSRTGVLAALPTLTRYSRTSLLTGRLAEGGQAEEKAGFAALTGGPLFHKADLVGGAGEALPPPVLEALRSQTAMCAVVLNTVDDALAKADPGGTDWTVDGIRHLGALLDEAGRAGRTVVLISDHGHVIERGGEARAISGAEARWRPPDTGPLDPLREVALAGPRVLPGSIVAAVDESLRYGTKQAGYHGGASPAEVVIPVIVLSRVPDDLRPAGWVPAAPQTPAWWNDPVITVAAPSIPRTPVARPPARLPGQDMLDLDVTTAADGDPAPSPSAEASALVDALLASPIYAARRTRFGARAAGDDVVRTVLLVLLAQSGRAHRDTLASAAGIPSMRLQGALTALRRQLNVEGYEVISMDVDGVTVLLDTRVLRQQYLEDAGG